MRRRVVIVLLALGTIGGYAAGFHSLHGHVHHGCPGHHDAERADTERGP